MNLIKYIITFSSLFVSGILFGQLDTAGAVFVSNDYREVTSDAVVVKWVANKVYYQKGFDVFRQEKGQQNWNKLTATPIMVKSKIPTYLSAQDPDAESLLDYVNDMEYADFQKNLIRVFVAIKSVESGGFAEALGVIYYDESAVKGQAYRYKVVGNTTSSSETIHISTEITSGVFVPHKAPQNIATERKKKQININWQVENDRFYGVHIYRKSSIESDFKQLTESTLAITKAENQKGEFTYPEIYYVDHDINKDLSYTYELVAVDYFGNEGTLSEDIALDVVDFDPPLPPYEVKADARLLGVEVTWKLEQQADLAGVNIYRHQHPKEAKIKRNPLLLSFTDTLFYEEVAMSGGYYYTVGAVDLAGNESFSGEIFIDVHDLIPPAAPQNVYVKVDTGKVALVWDAVTDSDTWGYFVHRSLNDEKNEDNEFIILNKEPVIETSYSEELPKNVKNKFVYKVVAVDSAYNRSTFSSLSVVKLPDVTPPQSPFIKNIHTDHSTIKIQWLAYHEDGLAGFDIFRPSDLDSAKYYKINKERIGPELSEFVDGVTIAGENYFYYLVAIDEAGNISTPSGVFKGKSDSGKGGKESSHHDELAVTSLKVKLIKKKRKVKLTWVNPTLDNFIGVTVYGGTSKNELKPISGKIMDTFFTDSNIKKGTVFYQIRTYDDHGHKSLSKTLKVEVK